MRFFSALVVLLLLAGCATDRYVGSIGRTRVFSNRGFGLAVDLSIGNLEGRWVAVDPSELSGVPAKQKPEPVIRLDLNGDGQLGPGEDVEAYRPTLRLYSRTSTRAVMDIDVSIVGGDDEKKLTPELALNRALEDINALTSTATVQRSVAGPDYLTLTTEVQISQMGNPAEARVSLLDQPHFVAESDIERRQIVTVVLSAPKITPELRKDHQYLVQGIILNKVAGTATSKERW